MHTLKKLTSTQFFGNSDGTTFVSNRMRKGTVLTTEDQTAIIKQLESRSAEVIAERYGVGKSMISDIKKEFSQNFLCLKQGMRNIGMSKKAKVEMIHSTTRLSTRGSNKSEWRVGLYLGQYGVSSCT